MEDRPLVQVVPLGRVDETAVNVTAAHLQAVLDLNTQILSARPVPDYALVPGRHQYNALSIIDALTRDAPPSVLRLGLLRQDLCLPIMSFVYGEAQIEGQGAVVSLYRLGTTEDGRPVSPDQLYDRLAKITLHEMAHVLGLIHCRAPGCLMRFSPNPGHIDRMDMIFCPDCSMELVRRRTRLFRNYLASEP